MKPHRRATGSLFFAFLATTASAATYTNSQITPQTLDEGNASNVVDQAAWLRLSASQVDFHLGVETSGNTLTIQNGSTVEEVMRLYIGYGVPLNYTLEDLQAANGDESTGNVFTITGYNESNTALIGYSFYGIDGAGEDIGSSMMFNYLDSYHKYLQPSDVYVGTWGNDNSMIVTGGAHAFLGLIVVGDDPGFSHAVEGGSDTTDFFPALGNGNHILVTGSTTKLDCYGISLGWLGSYNTMTVSGGAYVHCNGMGLGVVGSGSEGLGHDNHALVTGAGTILDVGGLVVGKGGNGNKLEIADGALVRMTTDDDESLDFNAYEPDNQSTGADNWFVLGEGYIALKGDWTTSARVATLLSEIKAGGVPASVGDVSFVYFADTDNGDSLAKDMTAADEFAGYGDLGGYTILAAGDRRMPDVTWADASAERGDWYDSSFYGWFYTTYATDGWIWHGAHGWQYVYPQSTADAMYLWDCATNSWWYTQKTDYPMFYQYRFREGEWGGAWYYYEGGASPDRAFWDYATNGSVAESALVQ